MKATFLLLPILFIGCATNLPKPQPVAGLPKAEAVTSLQVQNKTLAWTANPVDQQISAYRVYRGNGTLVATVQITSIRLPVRHSYYVTAINIRCESPPSIKVSL